MKRCRKCLQEKEASEFGRNRGKCKECRRDLGKVYRAEHLEKERESCRRYQATHKEELRKKKQEYYSINREKRLAQGRAYYAAHAEKLRQYRRVYATTHAEDIRLKTHMRYYADPEKMRARKRLHRDANLEKLRDRERKWRITHPETVHKQQLIRKVRQRGAVKTVPIHHKDIAARDRWICHICHKRVTQATWSLDHLIPISLGGSHTPENVALAHKRCNSKRGIGKRIPAQLRLLG